jgi:broad specificity phosphatase PhoE
VAVVFIPVLNQSECETRDLRPATSPALLLTVPVMLARHGETADNTAGRILGRRDPPLSAGGVLQARRLGATLRGSGIAALWSSPLLRARRTAEIAGEALGLEPVLLDALLESARGAWEGQVIARIRERDPDGHAAFVRGDADFVFPGGESLREQRERTRTALEIIAQGSAPALVVAHAGTIRAALALCERPVPPESALAHGEVVAVLGPPGSGR